MRTAKALIRLGKCPGWSESLLGTQSFCWFCSWGGSFGNTSESSCICQHLKVKNSLTQNSHCVPKYDDMEEREKLWAAEHIASFKWSIVGDKVLFSSPEQSSRRAIVLPPASALALALESASTNVKVVKDFRTSLFPNSLMDLVYIWLNDRYWSKILFSTIPTPMHNLKVKIMDLELLC